MKNIFALDDIVNGDTEFFPLMSPEDEKKMNEEEIPEELPILPLRNMVLFPGVVIPITAGREKSVKLLREAYQGAKIIGVVAQKDAETEDPGEKDLHPVGTVARIIKILQMPDGNTTAIIQGKRRFVIEEMLQEEPYFKAKVKSYGSQEDIPNDEVFQALISSIRDLAIQIIEKSPVIPSESSFAINNIESPVFLINFVSSNLNVDNGQKQQLLEMTSLEERANKVLELLTKELQVLELKNQIQTKVKVDLDKQQRDYLLNQQLKTIQEELGGAPHEQDIKKLEKKAARKKWPEEVAETFQQELSRLQRMNPNAAEYSIQMNYLEFLVDLPWNEFTKDHLNLKRARQILDKDHYGLEKIKERIIEYLAVLKLKNDMKAPILCFVGPPGVGKTSLGRSIARALGRKYVRMSLGGLRDESELRGHRKTYIGAMPGRILQNLKKTQSANPVFMLDEIDKVSGNNFSGDPQAALLEILDPEQNNAFYDNYLELDFDLSKVMFIATANSLSGVHPALVDRMEVIELSGYLLEEKVEIARRHLLKKIFEENGIQKKQLVFPKKTIETIIDQYTREAGVRLLEKQIAKVVRNRARFIAMDEPFDAKIKPSDLPDILGKPRFTRDQLVSNEKTGVVTGLAWTRVGGEILFVEVSLSKGDGKQLKLTGNLGDVMKESAVLAYEFLKAHAETLGLEPDVFEKWNVHIHIPEGATPKDGPSAGVTMLTALASAFTQRKVRPYLAMTGEITLRGKVLPVGGIKEKILAAKRAKIKTILLPLENKPDIEEIPEKYIEGLDFVYVDEMLEVWEKALLPKE
ncbi:endopeptidase La [Candidatus Sulfidibacterium hydrothermale]|uniref:endopeptidase La n=1 Tax=Candidatus Sulfidibacterium hydrothermale TaxID=2875962 RepID=UPI001F0A463F|nr:endopeptidase La [Candidatus Sulfidibacterium hydrothermale]UBM61611.1 endopeptidase La [Candidatus Sulfidibacterium hydrothermale]